MLREACTSQTLSDPSWAKLQIWVKDSMMDLDLIKVQVTLWNFKSVHGAVA